LLPELTAAWNPALPETLARTADWALAEEAWWGAEIDRLAPEYLAIRPPAVLVRCDRLAELPLAVARRLIRRAAALAKGDLRGLDFGHIEAILALAGGPEGHGRLQVPGLDIFRSFRWLRLAPPGSDGAGPRNFRLPLPVPGSQTLPDGSSVIFVEFLDGPPGSGLSHSVYHSLMGCLDRDRISGSLEVRNWRPGDQYRRTGRAHEEKIKELFQQAKIPLWERRRWPVITSGDVILCVRLFGPAAAYAANPDSRAVLAIRETATEGFSGIGKYKTYVY
ncbi:MAG TPA: tRNA lysidine(34) synthetase TilS, partial [Bryobacteraceae bacterium]|nr:tRNA lysidine(34) synthetase TilS [Bryobacteraceae bacterium]